MPGAEIRAAVVAAAGGRCQCAGECGRKHARLADGRCEIADSASAPLHAVPRDLTLPPHRAVRLPAGGLAAMCGRCHDLAAARAARAHEPAPSSDPGPALWELP